MDDLLRFGDSVIDPGQIKTISYEPAAVILTFQNGDSFHVRWRDRREEATIKAQLSLLDVRS
jgi:hypothetical protein